VDRPAPVCASSGGEDESSIQQKTLGEMAPEQ
jgi:hypothetical protein